VSIISGSDAKLIQEGIRHHKKLTRLMADPENKFLADEIRRLEKVNERLEGIIDRLPGKPNQWNPHG